MISESTRNIECAMWNENLHRTFAFLWKEQYTCGGKKI